MWLLRDGDELTEEEMAVPDVETAQYSVHVVGVVLDGCSMTAYICDPNGPLIPGACMEFLHLPLTVETDLLHPTGMHTVSSLPISNIHHPSISHPIPIQTPPCFDATMVHVTMPSSNCDAVGTTAVSSYDRQKRRDALQAKLSKKAANAVAKATNAVAFMQTVPIRAQTKRARKT